MVKFQYLAQFSVDALLHPVVSSFILFLCKFATFAYCVINLVVSITYICYFVVTYILALISLVFIELFWAAFRTDSVSLLRSPFLSDVYVFSSHMSLVSRLKMSKELLFFPFLFYDYLVVLLVFVSSVLFLVTVISLLSCFSVESSSRCIDESTLSLLLENYLPPSFLTHIICQRHIWDKMPYAGSLVFLFWFIFFMFFSDPFQKWSKNLNREKPRYSIFDKISTI